MEPCSCLTGPSTKTYCALCSRLRRGHLYRIAREESCSAVVLGHHRDDILETFMLNLFHGGKLAAMPPKLVNDEGDLTVLRPLSHVAEADCYRFARAMGFPIIPCDLCGSQEGLQRAQIKAMLDGWEKNAPGRRAVHSPPHCRPGRDSSVLRRGLFRYQNRFPRLSRQSHSRKWTPRRCRSGTLCTRWRQ